MTRTKLVWSSLTACALMVTSGPAVFAQQGQGGDRSSSSQDTGDQSRDSQQQQQQKKKRQQQQSRDGQSGQSQSGQSKKESSQGQSLSKQERQEAIAHFLAGYSAGYTDGWVDGADELVIGIVGRQRQFSQQQVAAGRDPSKMQDGRRGAREQMRNRMRQESQKSKSGSQGTPMASFNGEVLALKTVPIKNTDIKHRVARLEGQDGRTRIVDLGPTGQTQKLNIEEGDTIQVRGTPVIAGDIRILAARQVTADGQKVDVKYEKLTFKNGSQVSTQGGDRQGRQDGRQGRQNGDRSGGQAGHGQRGSR